MLAFADAARADLLAQRITHVEHRTFPLPGVLEAFAHDRGPLTQRVVVTLPGDDPWPRWELVRELALGPHGAAVTAVDWSGREEGHPPGRFAFSTSTPWSTSATPAATVPPPSGWSTPTSASTGRTKETALPPSCSAIATGCAFYDGSAWTSRITSSSARRSTGPPPTGDYITLEWARRWPAEAVWVTTRS